MNEVPGINPCRDCKKRYIGCHGECKEYLEWSAKAKALNEKIRQQNMSESYGYHDKPKRKKR